MLLLFLTAFSAVFVALTLVYLSLQDQQARLVWVLVYLLLVLSQGSFSNKNLEWSLPLDGKTNHTIRPVVG